MLLLRESALGLFWIVFCKHLFGGSFGGKKTKTHIECCVPFWVLFQDLVEEEEAWRKMAGLDWLLEEEKGNKIGASQSGEGL